MIASQKCVAMLRDVRENNAHGSIAVPGYYGGLNALLEQPGEHLSSEGKQSPSAGSLHLDFTNKCKPLLFEAAGVGPIGPTEVLLKPGKPFQDRKKR
jgi:hypothetical protein